MNTTKKLLQNDEILIYDDSVDPLNGRTKKEMIGDLRNILAGRVEEAYVFGSFATDYFSKDSDIDILLVAETPHEFHKRYIDFPELYDIIPRLDLLVYTPDEFDRMKETGCYGFWKSVFDTAMKIL